jgi:hypothetical protein
VDTSFLDIKILESEKGVARSIAEYHRFLSEELKKLTISQVQKKFGCFSSVDYLGRDPGNGRIIHM